MKSINRTDVDIDEILPFIRNNTTTIRFVENVNGHDIHLLDDIVKQIYNNIVLEVLNPIIETKTDDYSAKRGVSRNDKKNIHEISRLM